MTIKDAAERLLGRLSQIWPTETKGLDDGSTREAYRQFLASAWRIFKRGHPPDIEDMGKSETWGAARKNAETLAGRLRIRKLPLRSFTSATDLLSLVMAVDEVAADDDIWIVGDGANVKYSEVRLDTDKFHVFLDLRASLSTYLSPAGRQFDPIAAIRKHRIVPAEVGGRPVKFVSYGSHLIKDVNSHSRPTRVYAGCYSNRRDWSGAGRLVENGQTTIRYFSEKDGLPDSRELELRDHLMRARAHEADVVLLPELTVSEDIVLDTQFSLYEEDGEYERTNGEAPPWRDTIVLPGTFHKLENNKKLNVAHVHTGGGETLFKQYKLKRYRSSENENSFSYEEQIDGGTDVLLYEFKGDVFIVLTCIDFCDIAGASAFSDQIEATIIMVPSMGGSTTISAHKARCKKLGYLRKSCVVIAQECLSEPTEERSDRQDAARDKDGSVEVDHPGWFAIHDRNKFQSTFNEHGTTHRVWEVAPVAAVGS